VCAAIKYHFNIVTVPHLLCNGFSKEETEDALIDLEYLGIHNILAISGDSLGGSCRQTMYGYNRNASELTKQILNMNQGILLDQHAEKTQFVIGVGCYPEKHFEAPNMQYSDTIFLKKQRLGASYAVTQMFFNTRKFFNFLARIKNELTIPIIPAIKIMTNAKQVFSLSKNFHIDIPEPLVAAMSKAHTKTEQIDTGVNWAFEQCQSLIESGHTHIHFYIMRDTSTFLALLEKLDKQYSLV